MENIQKDIISVLNIRYLIPGFISAWIFYNLTPHNRPAQFERIIQALIFTVFIQISSDVIRYVFYYLGQYKSFGQWTESTSLIWSVICAIFIGFIFAYISNSDKIHNFLRKKGITTETSYPSEWVSIFSKNITYVILHLEDERRVLGWPKEWPSDPVNGHFLIKNPIWIRDKIENKILVNNKPWINNDTQDYDKDMEYILIRAKDIKWVEFLKLQLTEDI